MDLGNILTTLGTSYINARFQQTPDSPYIPNVLEDIFYGPNSAAATKVQGQMAPDGTIVNIKRCPKRRRRRRLATVSDIRDLAALQQVLGNGQNFKTWIATRGR